MRLALHAVAIASALWLATPQAMALGVGRVANSTSLGQPLDFSATIRLDSGESLAPECVSADILVGDRTLPEQAVRVTVSGDASSAERRVRVTTIPLVDEPIVSVTLRIGCPMQYSRNFVLFVDPPAVNLAQTAPTVTEPAAASDTLSGSDRAPAAASTTAAPSAGAAPEAAARPAPRRAEAPPRSAAVAPARRAERSVQRPPVAPDGARSALAPRVAQARPAPGPVLKLDPALPAAVEAPKPGAASADTVPAATPVESAAPAEAAAADAAASAAAAERAAAEEAALRALEQSLTALRNEALSTQRSVAILQARLAAAEAQRYNNALVYALGAAVVLLAIALLVTMSRLRSVRRESGWWSQSTAAPPTSGVREAEAVAETPSSLAASPMSTQPSAATSIGVSSTSSMMPLADSLKPGATPIRPSAESRREVTVEELIDLEQQAEFFLVLGQDDAAIDVLMGHLRSTGGATPLPYLKLLEIYRRRGDRDAYERIRDRFNRRFNAYAPEWGSDLQHGRSLEDYPAMLAKLQAQWGDPSQAMATLEASLLREGEGSETFDLPAYREILFLYSLARDHAEHQVPETVDLLLPLGEEGPVSAIRGSSSAGRPPAPASKTSSGSTPASGFDRSERYDVDFQFGSGDAFTKTGSRGGGTPRKG